MLNESENLSTHWIDHGLKYPDVKVSDFGCIFFFTGAIPQFSLSLEVCGKNTDRRLRLQIKRS